MISAVKHKTSILLKRYYLADSPLIRYYFADSFAGGDGGAAVCAGWLPPKLPPTECDLRGRPLAELAIVHAYGRLAIELL